VTAWLGFLLAVIALAGPRSGRTFEKRLSEGVDLMLVLDISGSMQAVDDAALFREAVARGYYHDETDTLTNRLVHAKKFAAEFIEKRPDDRIGLVVFAGYSFTKCPLTFDHGLLLRQLGETAFSDVSVQSTAIGVALANALNRLVGSPAKNKVVVLITDGANNAGMIDPLTASGIARSLAVRVYPIGFGSKTPLMPAQRPGYYVPSQTDIDNDALAKIAEETGGRYYHANVGGELGTIFAEIDTLEKSVIEKRIFVEYRELFQPLLLWALVLLALSESCRHLVFRARP
jgi:Ca-activated chloride channel family protein